MKFIVGVVVGGLLALVAGLRAIVSALVTAILCRQQSACRPLIEKKEVFARPDPARKKSPYTKEELFQLLDYNEKFQHERFNFFLVAQSLFFTAAATTIGNEKLLATGVLILAGFVICILFEKINIKQQIRVSFLIESLRSRWPCYDDSAGFHSLHDYGNKYKPWLNDQINKSIRSEDTREDGYSTPKILTRCIPKVLYLGWFALAVAAYARPVCEFASPYMPKVIEAIFCSH